MNPTDDAADSFTPSAGLDRIAAAKLWIVSSPVPAVAVTPGPRGLPYLSEALYALVTVPSAEVASAACDEHWRVYINLDWLCSASIPAIGAELLHLTWHLLHDHAARARNMHVTRTSAQPWHLASDAAIEPTLTESGTRPSHVSSALELGLRPRLSAEEYYAILSGLPAETLESGNEGEPDDDEPGCGSGCDGIRRAYDVPPTHELSKIDAEDARQIRRAVAIAYRDHITSIGTEPGDVGRWARDILEPTIRWEPLLNAAVRRSVAWAAGRTDYTYTRRSRRQSAVTGVVLPGMRRAVPEVAVIVDTSASVDDALLARALGEVDGALRGLGVAGASITVLAVDAAVQIVGRVTHARDVRLAGGGGTDMSVGIAAAQSLRPRPEVCIVLTDGHTPWPDDPPAGMSVIVVLLHRTGTKLPPTPRWAIRIEVTP